jgi:hypothetical protein
MDVGPRTDLDLPPPAHSRLLEIAALVLLVLVVSLYLMSRFPDLGLVIERYNRF